MDQDTDQLRYDIERRRDGIEDTLDAIGDRVLPGRIVERRREQVRQGVRGVRDRVMGTAHDVTDSVSTAGGQVGPDAIGRQVAGHPLGAGLVAAGLGFLVAAAIPRSSAEVQVARSVADAAAPVKDQVQQAAREVGQGVADEATAAATELKETATGAAANVTEQAKHEAQAARDEMRQ